MIVDIVIKLDSLLVGDQGKQEKYLKSATFIRVWSEDVCQKLEGRLALKEINVYLMLSGTFNKRNVMTHKMRKVVDLLFSEELPFIT